MSVSTTAQDRSRLDARDGRRETMLERSDRQFGELLQELRVIQTGVQVLFAFLLGVPFAQGFTRLDDGQRLRYFGALLLAGLSVLLLLAPTVWHRLVFSLGDKSHLIAVSQRLAIAGLACVGLTVIAVIALIGSVLYPGVTAVAATTAVTIVCFVLWAVLPLRRRAQDLNRS